MNAEPFAAVVSSPIGRIGVRVAHDAVTGVDVLAPDVREQRAQSEFAARVIDELLHYFEQPRWRFTVAVAPAGTPFQRRVWAALCEIRSGEVQRYGELAKHLGTAARAVGGACRANPVPIIVPCHRVVSATGLGGYMGATQGAPFAIKQWLLRHEGRR